MMGMAKEVGRTTRPLGKAKGDAPVMVAEVDRVAVVVVVKAPK